MSHSDSWLELESDPGLFTLLLQDFGVSGVEVEDVVGLEFEHLQHLASEGRSPFGFIFLFKWICLGRRKRRGQLNLDDEESHAREVKDESILKSLFFAHQIIPNSCASHALLSILLNCEQIDLGDQLTNFKNETRNWKAEDRGMAISNLAELAAAHNKHAKAQTRREALYEQGSSTSIAHSSSRYQQDTFHFTSFVPVNERLYELDGLKNHPIDHGEIPEGITWIEKFRAVILQRIHQTKNLGPGEEIRYNLMAVVPSQMKFLQDRLRLLRENRQKMNDWCKRAASRPLKRHVQQALTELQKRDIVSIKDQPEENAPTTHVNHEDHTSRELLNGPTNIFDKFASPPRSLLNGDALPFASYGKKTESSPPSCMKRKSEPIPSIGATGVKRPRRTTSLSSTTETDLLSEVKAWLEERIIKRILSGQLKEESSRDEPMVLETLKNASPVHYASNDGVVMTGFGSNGFSLSSDPSTSFDVDLAASMQYEDDLLLNTRLSSHDWMSRSFQKHNIPGTSNNAQPLQGELEKPPPKTEDVKMTQCESIALDLGLQTPLELTTWDIYVLSQKIQEEISSLEVQIAEEKMKLETYKETDERRVHDYDPFIQRALWRMVQFGVIQENSMAQFRDEDFICDSCDHIALSSKALALHRAALHPSPVLPPCPVLANQDSLTTHTHALPSSGSTLRLERKCGDEVDPSLLSVDTQARLIPNGGLMNGSVTAGGGGALGVKTVPGGQDDRSCPHCGKDLSRKAKMDRHLDQCPALKVSDSGMRRMHSRRHAQKGREQPRCSYRGRCCTGQNKSVNTKCRLTSN